MPARADKIAARLPRFYNYHQKGSSIRAIVTSSGSRMEEAEKEYVAIMRSHWVDTALNADLDRLGALLNVQRRKGESDNNYRARIKTTIISYKGGGTPESIREIMRNVLFLPKDYPIKIMENPPVSREKAFKAYAGKEWTMRPDSVEPATPEISLSLTTESAEIKDPTITNVSTGESLSFTGKLKRGDTLVLKDGKALLNGKDKTSSLTVSGWPTLPCEETKWLYSESGGASVGTFDKARFDTSVFSVNVDVTMRWAASEPASFELYIPGDAMMKANVTTAFLQELLDSIKACGVKAVVKVI